MAQARTLAPQNIPTLKRSLSVQIPLFVAVRTVVNTAVRMVYPFLPVFGRGLGVDLRMLSLAITARSASGVLSPFLGSVADSRGRKAGMLLGLFLFTAGIGLMAIWPTYLAFAAALILSMVGNYVLIPSMQAYLGDRVPYQRRGLVLALSEFGWSLSFLIGVPLVGLLIARQGWQAPFPFLAGLGAIALGALAILLPKDPTPASDKPGLWRNLRAVFTYPPALAGITLGLALSASNELVNLIFGVWMEDSFGVKIATLAAASVVIGISEFSAEALVSGLTDRLGKSRSVGLGLVLNSLAALALPVLGRSTVGALAGLFCLYITFEFTIVSSLPLMTEVMPATRATLMANYIAGLSVGRALGALLAPQLYHPGAKVGGLPGILAIALAAAALDGIALVALGFLKSTEKR